MFQIIYLILNDHTCALWVQSRLNLCFLRTYFNISQLFLLNILQLL